jgi:hypothetical protein
MSTLLKNRVGDAPATEIPEINETTLIERDTELYERVTSRLAQPAETVPAEQVLGSLDDDEE